MGDAKTKTVEAHEEEVQEEVCAPASSTVHVGSTSATPETIPRRLPMTTPAILPTPQPLPLPSYMLGRGPFPLLLFVPVLFLAPMPSPWRFPLYWPMATPLLPLRVPLHFMAGVRGRIPVRVALLVPALAPQHLRARVPGRNPVRMGVPVPSPAQFLARMLTPAQLLARMLTPATFRFRFVRDVQAAGKYLPLLALLQQFDMSGSYANLMTSVEQLFEGQPHLLVAFNRFYSDYADLMASVQQLFEGHPDLQVTFNRFFSDWV